MTLVDNSTVLEESVPTSERIVDIENGLVLLSDGDQLTQVFMNGQLEHQSVGFNWVMAIPFSDIEHYLILESTGEDTRVSDLDRKW